MKERETAWRVLEVDLRYSKGTSLFWALNCYIRVPIYIYVCTSLTSTYINVHMAS